MTPERRRRVEELFHAALEREPALRAAWLDQTCGADESLRHEVEELLSHAGRAEGFLEKPAVDIAARQLAGGSTELPPGHTLGRYRILAPLGAGGMGTVYSARDSTLGRTVALKFLQPEFTGDPGRMERFRREARTLSALNHPNICTIYDIAEADGLSFISMEYVPGKTLQERIGRKGMKPGEVLKYGAQIADGMAKAHDAGIVHRDLKPTNIIITEEGQAKLLDFGIAKLTAQSDPPLNDDTATLSLAGKPQTEQGAIIGTIAYLSPEQAEGRLVDTRSDIFSFGAVLYEMITGVKAFRRESRSATLLAILNEEPKPMRQLAPDIHPELEKIVARCLRKDPERRLRSMADLGLALRELREDTESGRLTAAAPAVRLRQGRKTWLWVGASVAAAAVAGGLLTWWILARQPSRPVIKTVPLTTYQGVEKDPSLSPDGSQVAFAWNGEKQNNFDIYVKAIGPGPPLRLTTDPAEDVSPAWAPDGSTIAFLRNRGIGKYSVMLIPALGGVERKLADVSIENRAWVSGPYISWMPDSQSLAVVDQPVGSKPSAVFLVSLRSQERRQLTFPPAGIIGDGCAAVSPDGNALAFCRHGAFGEWSYNVYSVELGQNFVPHGNPHQLTLDQRNIEGVAWTPDSRNVVFSSGAIWKIPVSGNAVAAGTVTRLLSGIWPALARHSPRLVYIWSTGGGLDIWRLRIPRPGTKAEQPEPLIASTANEFAQQYSPDGKHIAFESNRSGNLEIWSCDSDGRNCTQLTSLGAQFTGVPTWSPDGRQIAFYTQKEGKSQVYVVGSEGGATRRLTDGLFNDFYPRWSRGGAWVYFASNRTGRYEIWKTPAGGGSAVQLTRNGGFAASESMDGRWLYYTKNQNSDSGLWKMPLSGGDETQVLPSVVLHNYAVVEDGIYFIVKSGDNDYSIRFFNNTTVQTQMVAPVHAGYVGFSVSPDRKSILYTENTPAASDLVLVEKFP